MRRERLLTGLLVAAVAFVVHARTLTAGFVYDDHRFVEENAAIRTEDPVAFFADPGTASARTGIQPDVYRPLRTLGYALDHALFGLDPTGWHVENLLWHALAAFLVFRLLVPLLRGNAVAAALGALLFAVHPVTGEAVAWISSRGDLMAVALLVGALVLLERPGVARTVLGTALALAACFAKESAVVAPALLPLRDLALPREVAPPRRTTALRTGLLAVAVLGYLALRLSVIPDLAQVERSVAGGRVETARAMLAGVAWYGGTLVLPHGFPFDVFLPVPFAWDEPAVVVGLGLLATVLLAGATGLARGPRLLAFAALGALACLVPVSNVLVPLKILVAERFLYPVLVCAAAGLGLLVVSARTPLLRRLAVGLSGAALLALAVVTWQRDANWRDDATLWDAVRRDRPDNPRAYEGIGFAAYRRGQADLAEKAYRSYLEHNPYDGKSWAILGHTLGKVVNSLYVRDLGPGVETNVEEKRRQALVDQLDAYDRALGAWREVGLVRGRGSPALLREVLARRRDAAWLLGDFALAREANEALLGIAGFAGAPPERVLAEAPSDLAHARLVLALRSLLRPLEQLPAEAYEHARGVRALLLGDVGIDAAAGADAALEGLRARFVSFLAREPDHPQAVLNLADLLRRQGREGEAASLLRDHVLRHPERREIRDRLLELERRP